MKRLNLGCGSRFCDGWVNVNFTLTGEGVIAADLVKNIPFPDESFDLVYHSHLLEHLPKTVTPAFLKECCRVLRPGGIIRIAVPDLEAIARNYLLSLEKAKAGLKGWSHNYDWMLLEMYDQVVRNQSGGEIARYLSGESICNEEFVVKRCGGEVKRLIEKGTKSRVDTQNAKLAVASCTRKVLMVLCNPKLWKECLFKLILGSEYEILQIGRFRTSGENHLWMYDSYSLGRLLADVGFDCIEKRTASESYIPDWINYNLDTEPDGLVYKPDSVFVEAIKT